MSAWAIFSQYYLASQLYFYPCFSTFCLVSAVNMPFVDIFIKVKKEMIQANRLLYIINFDILDDSQKQDIANFLTKYWTERAF